MEREPPKGGLRLRDAVRLQSSSQALDGVMELLLVECLFESASRDGAFLEPRAFDLPGRELSREKSAGEWATIRVSNILVPSLVFSYLCALNLIPCWRRISNSGSGSRVTKL